MAVDPFKQSQALIEGDLDIAVTAQVNRWAKKLGFTESPLIPGTLTIGVAGYAYALLQARLAAALASSFDLAIMQESVALNQEASNIYAYVRANREIITQTLARYGDSLGLPPAVAGITRRKIPTWVIVTAIGGGLLAAGALAGMLVKRKNRALPAGS
jgi:hypothetical protein